MGDEPQARLQVPLRARHTPALLQLQAAPLPPLEPPAATRHLARPRTRIPRGDGEVRCARAARGDTHPRPIGPRRPTLPALALAPALRLCARAAAGKHHAAGPCGVVLVACGETALGVCISGHWAVGSGRGGGGGRGARGRGPRAAGLSLSLSHVCHERELKTTRTINHPGHGGTDARAVPTRRVTGPSRTLRPPASAVPAALGSGSGLLAAETRRLLPRIARRDCSARSAQRGERGERGISRQ